MSAPTPRPTRSNTLLLFENLDPILDQEGTRAAYRLEVDLLPMVLEMRRRGIRIDQDAAEQARDLLLANATPRSPSFRNSLVRASAWTRSRRNKWKARTFDAHGITYPRTEKGNPSFTAGKSGWMAQACALAAAADRRRPTNTTPRRPNFSKDTFSSTSVNGRIHAEIHPLRSDDGGTRSSRFSYSNPPLQQMPAHDEELAPLIRGVFLPEEGEVWAKPDATQQEFRFIVHYAAKQGLRKADEAAERYRNDPDTDFHALVAEWTGLDADVGEEHQLRQGVRRRRAQVRGDDRQAGSRGARDL